MRCGMSIRLRLRWCSPDTQHSKRRWKQFCLQADEILVKPMNVDAMVALIREKLRTRGTKRMANIERVANILERDSKLTIANWLARVGRGA